LLEILDIWNENGKPTGQSADKAVLHQNGLFHPTVHIWFYTTTSNILLQKRASNKQTFPNHWDVSVAGHVISGETVQEAAVREVNEEIGLSVKPKDLDLISVRKNVNKFSNGIIDAEFQHVFLCELPVAIEALSIQKEEVDAVRLFSFGELKKCQMHKHPDFSIVPADMEYYTFIMKAINDKLLN
jgi:isopentenyldiphosphate isomerase